MSFGYSKSVNIIRLLLCGNTELVAKNNSAWMFDAPLQLQPFCFNPFSSFVLWLLFLEVCMSVWVWMCVFMWYISFERSYYIQWNLYDNCAAGDFNYTFSQFTISSHHLLVSRCKVRWNEPGLCCTTLYLRDLYSPQLSLSHHALKSRRFHYVYLRCLEKNSRTVK